MYRQMKCTSRNSNNDMYDYCYKLVLNTDQSIGNVPIYYMYKHMWFGCVCCERERERDDTHFILKK